MQKDPLSDPLNEMNKQYERYYEDDSLFEKALSSRVVKLFLMGGVFICALYVAGFFLEQPIAEKIFAQVKDDLQTELQVKEFSLSFFKSFPEVQVDFKGVQLKGLDDKPFVEAGALGFKVGLLSLFMSPIKVKSVVVEDGSLYLMTDKSGKNNYDIFSSTDDTAQEGEEISLNIQKAIFKEVELIYEDERANQFMRVDIKNGTLRGEVNSTFIALESEATLLSHFFEIGGIRYLTGKELTYHTEVDLNLKEKKYAFNYFEADINGYPLALEGSVQQKTQGIWYDLKMGSEQGNIASLLQLIPGQYLPKALEDIESNGDFSFKAYIKGLQNNKETPKVLMKILLDDGSIDSKSLNAKMKGISFAAKFDNGGQKNMRTASLAFDKISGQYGRQRINGSFSMHNFEDPTINLKLDGIIDLNQVYSFLEIPNLKEAKGEVEVSDFVLKGRYRHVLDPRFIHRVSMGGEINLQDVVFEFIAGDWELPAGKLNFSNELVSISDFNIRSKQNDIKLGGRFYNLLPVLFADSLNSKNAELKFESNLVATNIDINEWNRLFDNTSESEEPLDSMSTESLVKRNRTIKLLNGHFDANIDALTYGKIHADAFEGKISIKDEIVWLDGDAETMSGFINLEGKLYLDDVKPHLKMNVTCEDIDIHEFFKQNENFGQTLIKHDNLYGNLTSFFLIDCYWNQKGMFLTDDLKIMGHIVLEDGRLKDFKMLENLKGLVAKKKLNDVRFTKLENWMEISNSTLYIPTMFVQNNAMNLKLAGVHTFEQEIDYNIMVNATQTIGRMFNSKVSEIIPNKKGWLNIYSRVHGNVDDFEISNFKSRMVKHAFGQHEDRKNKIRHAIQRDFGSRYVEDKTPDMDDEPDSEKETVPADPEKMPPNDESDMGEDTWEAIEISETPVFDENGGF